MTKTTSGSDRHTVYSWNRSGVVRFIKVRPTITISASGEVEITETLDKIKKIQKELGVAISLHAVLIYWLSQALQQHPLLKSYRKGKKMIEFADVNVCSTILKKSSSRKRELKIHVFRAAQEKSLAALQMELRKEMKAETSQSTKSGISSSLSAFYQYIRMRFNPFVFNKHYGNVLISNLQSPGFNIPFFPVSPSPFTLTLFVGPVFQRVAMEKKGEITEKSYISLVGAADHTIVDGYPLSRFAKTFSDYAQKGYGLGETFVEEMKAFNS